VESLGGRGDRGKEPRPNSIEIIQETGELDRGGKGKPVWVLSCDDRMLKEGKAGRSKSHV